MIVIQIIRQFLCWGVNEAQIRVGGHRLGLWRNPIDALPGNRPYPFYVRDPALTGGIQSQEMGMVPSQSYPG